MDAKIFYVSHRDEDAKFCSAVSKRINMEAVPVTRPEVLPGLLQTYRQSAVFIDVDHERALDRSSETYVEAVIEKACLHIPSARLFALADKTIFELPKLNRIASIGNYCLRKYDEFAHEWTAKAVAHSMQEETTELQTFMDSNAKETRVKITHSHKKGIAVQGIEKLLLAKGLNERSAQIVLQAVDELIMNAIFDAPMDEKGRPYRRHVERDSAFELKGKEIIETGIVLNEKTILIYVKDNFGSFSTQKAMTLIQKDYSAASYKTEASTQSAGLGLHGIVASGLGLTINVDPKVSTQAMIAFPIFTSFKSMRTSFRSFALNVKTEKKSEK